MPEGKHPKRNAARFPGWGYWARRQDWRGIRGGKGIEWVVLEGSAIADTESIYDKRIHSADETEHVFLFLIL